jgi:hypothetical protein
VSVRTPSGLRLVRFAHRHELRAPYYGRAHQTSKHDTVSGLAAFSRLAPEFLGVFQLQNGSMKLTPAPPWTQSTNTSLKSPMCRRTSSADKTLISKMSDIGFQLLAGFNHSVRLEMIDNRHPGLEFASDDLLAGELFERHDERSE